MVDEPDYSSNKEEQPRHVTIASAWRRVGAFVIDVSILGLTGLVAGAILHDQFSALGTWGRLLGLGIALAYFGLTESRLGGGQSLGMKILSIKVIASSGETLAMPAAFIRAGVFLLAYMLNNAASYLGAVSQWIATALSLLIFALCISSLYLFIFNRRTRQSIHDLAVDAFVVNAGTGQLSLPGQRLWRGHVIIAGAAICVLCVGGFLMSQRLLSNNEYAALSRVQRLVAALPGVDSAGVNSSHFHTQNGDTSGLFINAVVDSSLLNSESLARRIAQIALENDEDASRQQRITVSLTSGYDIGIAQSWRTVNHAHTPEEWKAFVAPRP